MSENIEGSSVTITEIMDFLPHRYPFLLVDRVVEVNGEQSGVGIKNVTASEPWFTGHFRKSVFPGVLIIEAIAQVSAILVLQHAKDSGNPIGNDLLHDGRQGALPSSGNAGRPDADTSDANQASRNGL